MTPTKPLPINFLASQLWIAKQIENLPGFTTDELHKYCLIATLENKRKDFITKQHIEQSLVKSGHWWRDFDGLWKHIEEEIE